MKEKVEKTNKKSLEVIMLKGDNPKSMMNNLRLPKKKYLSSKDILRIHSQLIKGFIYGSIRDDDAKSLSYLCTNYLRALKDVDLEERIANLERSNR